MKSKNFFTSTYAFVFAFLIGLSTLTGNATGRTLFFDNCACANKDCNASATCNGACYATCVRDAGCIAGCGKPPKLNVALSLQVSGLTLNEVCDAISAATGEEVSIKLFDKRNSERTISLEYREVPVQMALEYLTQFGTVYVKGIDFNNLLKVKKSLADNPDLPVTFSFNGQTPESVESYLSFLAGRELHFASRRTGVVSLTSEQKSFQATLESFGLR